jgi:hypothetical protein
LWGKEEERNKKGGKSKKRRGKKGGEGRRGEGRDRDIDVDQIAEKFHLMYNTGIPVNAC